MEKEVYQELKEKISKTLDELDRNIKDNFLSARHYRKLEYKYDAPELEEFNVYKKPIRIFYSTKKSRKQQLSGLITIASIRNSENGGLEGEIGEDRKLKELLEKAIHSFAHKYNLLTGNLL